MSKSHELSNFISSIADLLREPYRPPQYERVILPLVVLRRFDWNKRVQRKRYASARKGR